MPSRQQPNGSLLHGAQSVVFPQPGPAGAGAVVGAAVVSICFCGGAFASLVFFGALVVVVVVVVVTIGHPSKLAPSASVLPS